MVSFMSLRLLHIKEADAWKTVTLKQAAAQELLLNLTDLHSQHAGAIGCKLARGLLVHLLKIFGGSMGKEERKELFFECAEMPLEFFLGEGLLGELLQPFRDFAQRRDGGGVAVEDCRGRAQVLCNALLLEPCGFHLYWCAADCRLLHRFDGFHHGLPAPCEAVNFAHAGLRSARLIFIEGCIDATQHSGERHSSLSPGVDQGPVQRRQQEDGPATALEVFLYFREVVDVVLHLSRRGGRRCAARAWGAVALIEQAQAIQS